MHECARGGWRRGAQGRLLDTAGALPLPRDLLGRWSGGVRGRSTLLCVPASSLYHLWRNSGAILSHTHHRIDCLFLSPRISHGADFAADDTIYQERYMGVPKGDDPAQWAEYHLRNINMAIEILD
jgi:hypothetical protein